MGQCFVDLLATRMSADPDWGGALLTVTDDLRSRFNHTDSEGQESATRLSSHLMARHYRAPRIGPRPDLAQLKQSLNNGSTLLVLNPLHR